MNLNSRALSAEIGLGFGLIALGLLSQAAGWHTVLTQAMAPFGVGLVLSDLLGRLGKAAREKARIFIRRDE